MKLPAFVLSFAAVVAAATLVHADTLPPPDFTDIPAYIKAVNAATGPDAQQLRDRIANGPRDLARAKKDAERAGVFLQLSSLQQTLPPDADNAAPIYDQIAALLKAQPLALPDYAMPLMVRKSYTPEQIQAVRDLLTQRQDVVSLLTEATDRPRCVWNQDWTDLNTTGAAHFAGFPTLSNLLRDQAYLFVVDQKFSDAIAADQRILRMADHVRAQPYTVSYLEATTLDAHALNGFREVLIMAGANGDIDKSIEISARDAVPGLAPDYALKTDAAYGVALLEQARNGDPADLEQFVDPLSESGMPAESAEPPVLSDSDRNFVNGMVDAAEAEYLTSVVDVLHHKAPPQPTSAADASETSNDPIEILTGSDIASVHASDLQTRRILALQHVLAEAAEVLAQSTAGTFPDRPGHEYSDPFSTGPLQYRREGDAGFIVFSVGPSGSFDGGRAGARQTGQILFRYPAPHSAPDSPGGAPAPAAAPPGDSPHP